MSNLTRWDPFREMWSLRNMMDRWLEPSWSPATGWPPTSWDLALDVAETEDDFVVKASLPGINPDDLEITYNNNLLTIKGEFRAEEKTENASYLRQERRYGSFCRQIGLPAGINADKVAASFENGVLTLEMPKAAEAKVKTVKVVTK